MKALFLLALVTFSVAFGFPEQWETWKTEHGKKYESDMEEVLRHEIWEANRKLIEKHNANADELGFTLGMNEYADLKSSEFAQMNGYRGNKHSNSTNVYVVDPNYNANATVDWRTKGYVTVIKNQGQCGSCWAFSTTGSLEGQHFKQTGKLVSLSEQNLVDCSGKYGNLGCMGGLMDNAFRWIRENGGVDTEQSYPYRGDDGSCHFVKGNVGATDDGYVDIAHRDEQALMQAVARIGPISVAIDASQSSFQMYKSGVYHEPDCSDSQLDHGVLAVGYGTENGKDYWLVKNSWGESWGMDGYIMMSRNRDNNCGIATQASYPIV